MLECRIYVDWSALEDALDSSKLKSIKESCLALVQSVAPTTENKGLFFSVMTNQDEYSRVAETIVQKIVDANSKRFILIPLRGCAVHPPETKINSVHMLSLFRMYSIRPVIVVFGRECVGTARVLSGGLNCTIVHPSNAVIALFKCDKSESGYRTSLLDHYDGQILVSLETDLDCLCLLSVYGAVPERVLSSLFSFLSTLESRTFLISPDLINSFPRVGTKRVTYEGQVYLKTVTTRSHMTAVDRLCLPLPTHSLGHSFLGS